MSRTAPAGSGSLGSLLVLYLFVSGAFSLFEATRDLAGQLRGYFVTAIAESGRAILSYLPNLVWLIVIFLLARFAIRLAQLFFRGITLERIRIPGLHPELGNPTFDIVRVVIVTLAAVRMFPYLPGQQTRPFARSDSWWVSWFRWARGARWQTSSQLWC